MALKKEGLSRNTSQYKVAVKKTELLASAGLIKTLQRQPGEAADEVVFYAEAKKQVLLNSHWSVWEYSRAVSVEADASRFGDEALLC